MGGSEERADFSAGCDCNLKVKPANGFGLAQAIVCTAIEMQEFHFLKPAEIDQTPLEKADWPC